MADSTETPKRSALGRLGRGFEANLCGSLNVACWASKTQPNLRETLESKAGGR
jgi:hypothetical protein